MILKFLIILLNFNAIEILCDSKSSLTFVIDDTGSMGDDIEEVKKSANAIFDAIVNSATSPIDNFVLATFNDPETQLRINTKDPIAFKKALADISVYGGGDCPEYALSGIILGIENSRPGSTIYVFTDASAKDDFRYEEAKYFALKKQIQVVFILTGTCSLKNSKGSFVSDVYEKLAKDTSGEIFLLNKVEIHLILKYVIENVKGRRTPLTDSDFSEGSNSVKFTIDKHLTDTMVSVTGEKITLKVTDRDGNDANTESIVKLDNINILKLINPRPGEYNAEVTGGSDYHVHVSAMTDIEFQQGFSTFVPWSIEETTTLPMPDYKSYISIKTNDDQIDLKVVQLLDMDDHLIMELPLVLNNKQDNFYTTGLANIPGYEFKLLIIGYDSESDKDIMRIGPIVEPQAEPKKDIKDMAPSVTILGPPTQEVKWRRPFELKCKVYGHPQPKITWVNKATGEEPIVHVHKVELPYEYMSVLHVNGVHRNTSYECRANNSLGSDSASADIVLSKRPYFNIMKKLKDMTIAYDNEAILNCEAENYPKPANITWYKNMNVLLKNDNIEFIDDNFIVRIKKMSHADEGSYVCELKNDIARYLYSAQVTVTLEELHKSKEKGAQK